ncbi:MAG: ribosome biogenesis GTP-binding protein YihA/YsxC [Pseudomonadota bacterium]
MVESNDKSGRQAELLFERRWEFVMGVPSLDFLPEGEVSEIAFAGRSNVGKSSLINALLRQSGIARTSNTPGRTQELNFFRSDGVPLLLVDMPGYGFARAPKGKVYAWTELIKDYLRGRQLLRRVFLLIDARHGLKANDTEIMGMLDTSAVPYQVVLTKIDKLKGGAVERVVAATQDSLKEHPAAVPEVIATSSEKRIGISELRQAVLSAALIDPEHLKPA